MSDPRNGGFILRDDRRGSKRAQTAMIDRIGGAQRHQFVGVRLVGGMMISFAAASLRGGIGEACVIRGR